MFISPELTGAAHTALDLIQNEENILLIADSADLADEFRICRIDSALALDSLHDDGASGIVNERLHALDIIIFRKYDASHKRLERILIMRVPGDRQRADGTSVEGTLHRYDFVIILPVLQPRIFSCGFDRTFDSLRSAVREEYFGEPR